MPKKTLKQHELIAILTKVVNEGSFSSTQERALFESTWKRLSDVKRKEVNDSVAFHCLAMTDWMFLGKALDHCKEIATIAIATLIIAGAGAYYASDDRIVSTSVAVLAGGLSGLLTFSFYKNNAIIDDKQKRERLNKFLLLP